MDDQKFRTQLDDLRQQERKVRQAIGQEKNEDSSGQSSPSPALRYTWLGAEFAAIFIGFVWGGYTLDQRLGTKPWLLLAGIGLGFGLALYRLIFVAKKLGS